MSIIQPSHPDLVRRPGDGDTFGSINRSLWERFFVEWQGPMIHANQLALSGSDELGLGGLELLGC